jgi:hypothetical protein
MSAINRSLRTVTRTLRTPSRIALRAPLVFSATRAAGASRTSSATFKQFSTMSPLQSGAPPPPQAREYDPEIKDIASYVHNTPINSDLAVSSSFNLPGYTLANQVPLVRHREICFPRYLRMWSRRSALQRVHKAARPNRRGNCCSQRHEGSRNRFPA